MKQLGSIKFNRIQLERMERLGQEEANRMLYDNPTAYNDFEFSMTLKAVSELGDEIVRIFKRESKSLFC